MESHKFELAIKKVTSPELMNKFLSSKTYQAIVEFIKALQQSANKKKKSEVILSNNPCVLGLIKLLDELDKLIDETPPVKNARRFGNASFKTFHEKFENKFTDLMKLILTPDFREDLALELKSYFLDAFGSYMRLDYGTGHELNFLCILMILFYTQYYKEEDFSSIVLHVFFKYILLVRKIQVTYQLEPAGAHGVWGLDEYQFLPFLFGAAQLISHPDIVPSSIHDERVLKDNSDEYLYLNCIKHIKSVKHGASFTEYAPMLDSISTVKIWDKVAKGLVKMYEDEVLKKYVVIQHFYFGTVLVYE